MEPQALMPEHFTRFPWGSVLQQSEAETVASNIMKILKRTGNAWRELTWNEYELERRKDDSTGCIQGEQWHFIMTVQYTISPQCAALFSPEWKQVHPLTQS